MIRLLIFAFVLLCVSCRTIKYVPVETVKTEKEYIDRVKRDSIHVHDSVFVLMKGDTVFRDRYHTVYKDRYFRDTTYIHKIDSVQVPYPVEKPLSTWQNLKLQVGGFAMSAIVVIILIVVGKIVYKLKK
ncbi:MAG: hypothetical protein NC410_09000 [Oscillibacter sp.]|nr:hypothetical protein [Oscillibacter sp.]